jgi:hypothetical protein
VVQHDEYQLEDLAREHAIGAGLFVPVVIQRLRTGEQTETLRDLFVSARPKWRGVPQRSAQRSPCRLLRAGRAGRRSVHTSRA